MRTGATRLETRFRAMGTGVHVVVIGGAPEALSVAEQRIRDLERRWSRFLATSEINAINRNHGRPIIVSADTYELVTRAVDAWYLTGGRFDPTVGPALCAHGYDRDFAEVVHTISTVAASAEPAPGAAAIDLFPGVNAVTVPPGVTVDPGGIGKGLAADLTAQLVVDQGADGALVNVGGDLRAIGRAPSPEGWAVTVDDPIRAGRELLRLAFPAGAVATSSRLLRRWRTSTGEAHHLIDPVTGRPAQTDVVAVTVVTEAAWWAEALTKALFLAGPSDLAKIADLHAVIVTADGTRHVTGDLEATLR